MSARAKSPTKPGAKAAPAAAGANPLEGKLREAQEQAAADAQQRNYAQLEKVRQRRGCCVWSGQATRGEQAALTWR
jgi:hypothetical protein